MWWQWPTSLALTACELLPRAPVTTLVRWGRYQDTILLKTSPMRGIDIDAERSAARVEAGVLWQELTDAAAKFGLAGLAGSAADVGVVGYTLGGGLAMIGRRYGLACNHVLSAEVVTVDGRQRTVDAHNDPDLFWALRGGGGSYAVVTALTFQRACRCRYWPAGMTGQEAPSGTGACWWTSVTCGRSSSTAPRLAWLVVRPRATSLIFLILRGLMGMPPTRAP
jgi:hypothetical protein